MALNKSETAAETTGPEFSRHSQPHRTTVRFGIPVPKSSIQGLKGAVLMVAVLAAIGCSTVQVSQDFDPQANLARADTWQWGDPDHQPTGDIRADNPLLNKRIRRAIENHLAGRPIRFAPGEADLQLTYQLTIEQKIIGDTTYSTVGFGGYGYPWYGGLGTETLIRQYDESRLTIDLQAADTGELLWRGVGTYRWATYDTPEMAADAMQEVVDKILEQFPPVRPEDQ